MNLRFGTSAAVLALALAAGISLDPRAAADAKPGVDWPQFRGIRATGVGEGSRCPRPGTWPRTRASPGRRRPRPRPVEPDRLGRPRLRQHVDQRTEGRRSEGRALRRRQARPRRHRARVAHLLPRQEDRGRPLAADGAQGGPQDQAAHQGHARELHARDRRRAPDRLFRIGRALRLRPQGQAALEERPRRARRRLVHRPLGAMGNRQLAHPSRQRRRHPGRRAEGLVPRRVRRAGAARSCGASRGATCRRGARPRCIR